MPMPIVPIHRHSTKLSVIEGSVDDHATASESTGPGDQESVLATSPTRREFIEQSQSHLASGTLTPAPLDKLAIPSQAWSRTSSERAVAPDANARTSMMTATSGQSRISNLSDFPAPPLGPTAFLLASSNVLDNPFAARFSSFDPPVSPVSHHSVEPPTLSASSWASAEDRSVSEHHHQQLAMSDLGPEREFRANRATFGPGSEIASQWAERRMAATPTTEES